MSKIGKSKSTLDLNSVKVLSGMSDVNVPALRRTFQDSPPLLEAAASSSCFREPVPRPPCVGRVEDCEYWMVEDANSERCRQRYRSTASRNKCTDVARAEFFQSWCKDNDKKSGFPPLPPPITPDVPTGTTSSSPTSVTTGEFCSASFSILFFIVFSSCFQIQKIFPPDPFQVPVGHVRL